MYAVGPNNSNACLSSVPLGGVAASESLRRPACHEGGGHEPWLPGGDGWSPALCGVGIRGNLPGPNRLALARTGLILPPNAMTPIHELLSRIRWDRRFSKGLIEVGYLDRIERRILRVPFRDLRFPKDRRHVFEIVDADGVRRRIPFHRVREVRRDGQAVWRRPV